MVVPVQGRSGVDVAAGPVDSVAVAERLQGRGLASDAACELGHLARRSLRALRRRLALQPALHRPGWVDAADFTLRRCLLLNKWNRDSEGDIDVVQRFAGMPYREVEQRLERAARIELSDRPLMRTGSVWHAVSPPDAWLVAGAQLREEDLEELADIAVEVLGEPDPLQGLEGVERLRAQCDGTKPRHSQQLKEGLAASLAVLATAREYVPASARHIVDGAVARLLESANADATLQRWRVVAPSLPLLAEAAPLEVLEGLRTGLEPEEPLLAAMFSEREFDGEGFSRDVPKDHLLSALDVLSWSPRHFAAVTNLLATLAMLDPGTGLSERPARVLRDVMCPWMPNTAAVATERLAVLDGLRSSHPDVAWEIMLSMLPTAHMAKSDGITPRYREWKDQRRVPTRGEYNEQVAHVGATLIADAVVDPRRCAVLIRCCGDMLPRSRAELLRGLRRVAGSADEAARAAIWPALRQMTARHRKFSDTHWALPADEIAEFESLLGPLRPRSLSNSLVWLFDLWLPYLDGLGRRDRADHEAALDEQRTAAIRDIFDAGGMDAVVKFAESVEIPRMVGDALGRVAPKGVDEDLLARIASPEAPYAVAAEIAWGYFQTRFKVGGWALFDALISAGSEQPTALALLLRASGDPEPAWQRAEALGADTRGEYWKRFTRWDLCYDESLAVKAARRLGEAGRADTAIDLLASFADAAQADLEFAHAATEVLLQHLQQEGETDTKITYDAITSLLAVLHRHADTVGEQKVAEIEWAYLPALGWGAETPCLHKALAEDPEFFVEIVQIALNDGSSTPQTEGAEPENDAAGRSADAVRTAARMAPVTRARRRRQR